MGAPLTDHDPRDLASATQAWLAGPTIDRQLFRIVPRFSVGADVIGDARSAVRDPLPEDRAHRPMEASHLRLGQAVGRAQRMEARPCARLWRKLAPNESGKLLLWRPGACHLLEVGQLDG